MEPRQKSSFPAFISATIVIFVLSLSAADSVGFVPYYMDGSEPSASRQSSKKVALSDLPELGEEQTATSQQPVATSAEGVEPTHIKIAAIGLDLPISNPETRDITKLDELLKSGPARYVDSALLGENGNVLLFGHSSHLPIVHNQMYKAFNKIPDLTEGDTILVEGGGKTYEYRVTSVKSVDAEDGVINLAKTGKKLTIVTCDTLTGKSARFVAEAEYVGVY